MGKEKQDLKKKARTAKRKEKNKWILHNISFRTLCNKRTE